MIIMQYNIVKLDEISTILTGLPIHRYYDADDTVLKEVIQNIAYYDRDEKFETEEEPVSDSVKEQFYSREHDILYKIQQQIFAKEITTETDKIITNNYIIIRPDLEKVNSTFLTYYLNDPRTSYEIERNIDSDRIMKINTKILKELEIYLPDREIQDMQAELINKINKRITLKNQSIECDRQLIHSIYDNIIGDNYAI